MTVVRIMVRLPNHERSERTAWALYVEPVLGIVALAVAVAVFFAVGQIAATAPNDFTVFLESARALRRGADLYQQPLQSGPGNNLNTPAAVLLFVPFSFFDDVIALRAWTAIGFVAYAIASILIARAIAPRRAVSIAAAVVLSQAAITSLLLGQVGGVLMLLLTWAWLEDRHDRLLRAGVLLGIAIGMKPFLIVFVGYAVWRRSRPLAAGLAAGTVAVFLVGLLAAGMNGYRSWLAALGQISWSAHVANASLLGLLTRTLSTTPEILHATPIVDRPALVPPLWTAGIVLIAALGVRALVATKNLDRAWAVLLVGSLLVSPLGWVYYATMFTGPLLAVAMASGRWTRITIAAGYGCLLVPPAGVPSPGPIGVVVLGSIYGWGLLMVYAAVALARDPRR